MTEIKRRGIAACDARQASTHISRKYFPAPELTRHRIERPSFRTQNFSLDAVFYFHGIRRKGCGGRFSRSRSSLGLTPCRPGASGPAPTLGGRFSWWDRSDGALETRTALQKRTPLRGANAAAGIVTRPGGDTQAFVWLRSPAPSQARAARARSLARRCREGAAHTQPCSHTKVRHISETRTAAAHDDTAFEDRDRRTLASLDQTVEIEAEDRTEGGNTRHGRQTLALAQSMRVIQASSGVSRPAWAWCATSRSGVHAGSVP